MDGSSPGPAPLKRVVVDAELNPSVTLAWQQNGWPFLHAVEISNLRETPLHGLQLRISADPPFFEPIQVDVGDLHPGATWHHSPVAVQLSSAFLSSQTESHRGHVEFQLVATDGGQLTTREEVDILAPTHWPGTRVLPELLAAYVRPNAEVLHPVLKDVASRLEQITGRGSIDGYQSGEAARVAEIAQCVFEALQARSIRYIGVPASFERSGQKTRTHEQVLAGGAGNCLDLTLLAAALFEQCGLHPLVVLIDGHAFPGLWLTDFHLHECATDDPLPVRKRVELGEALVFDASAMAEGTPFGEARRIAEGHLDDVSRFRLAMDVRAAREAGVRPLPFASDGVTIDPAFMPTSPARGLAPDTRASDDARFARGPSPNQTTRTSTRVDKWKTKLLDLSLRNKLLNYRPGPRSLTLLGVEAERFEDALADGEPLHVSPRPNPHPGQSLEDARSGWLERATAQQSKGELLADHPAADMAKRIKELYRRSRAAYQESGAVVLYAAIGFLEWFESDRSDKPRRAPLILVPVELTKPRSGDRWGLKAAEEEPRINVTLLQKLKLDFGLDVAGLDQPPKDDAGLDVGQILYDVRQLVKDQRRWQVVDGVALSIFSFKKFLMWLDLEAKQTELERQPIVRHLLGGSGRAYPLAKELVAEHETDRARPPKAVTTVRDADPSQLQAIFAAEDGSSFVLQGPPGTGKSQTITNMIAQLLGVGKSVLFVSEKLAALQVVQRRLTDAGLEPFCLELHSHQATKKAVVEQLRRPFEVAANHDPIRWEKQNQELATLRDQLTAHADRLSKPSPFDTTARGVLASLFGLADTPDVGLPDVDVKRLRPKHLAAMDQAIADLLVAAEDAGDLRKHPLKASRPTGWSPDRQDRVEQALRDALASIDDALLAVAATEALLGDATRDHSLERLSLVAELSTLVETTPTPPLALVAMEGLRERLATVEAWAARGRAAHAERQRLLEHYQPSAFELDLPTARTTLEKWA